MSPIHEKLQTQTNESSVLPSVDLISRFSPVLTSPVRLKCYSLRDLAAPWISTTSAISITGTASPLEADRDIFESMGNNSSLTVHFEINNVLKGYLGYPFVGSNSDGPVETDHWHDVG